jgi:Raf kinase inhibitor-like YbhB/YbcL family protein
MPERFSSGGDGVSPALEWSGAPDGTVSYAIICNDPDAPLIGGFTHWVIYGIPGDTSGLEEGATTGFIAGANGLGELSWTPASPPPGHGTHYYYFHLYALGSKVSLEPGLTAEQLLARIDESVTVQARLVGTFSNE